MEAIFRERPHRRWNPLLGEWVIVSPHRMARPWQGQAEVPATQVAVAYDPACYLCPGNMRAGQERTPEYTGTYVFENDFAALTDDGARATMDVSPAMDASTAMDAGGAGLLRAETERGVCRVVCFDPRHDLTLATMPAGTIRRVVDVWAEQEAELAATGRFGYVQIFENRGAMMGASNPHPHAQIWATEHVPDTPARELATQRAYYATHGRSLLEEYVALELREGERIVARNETWVAVVPFWAVWPFELMLVPLRRLARMAELDQAMRDGLAEMLATVTRGYDRVFETPFPYSMGFHGAPVAGGEHPEWQLHAHFYPPLLRSATVRKFMVGFELLGSPQRDLTPEAAAETLRRAMEKRGGENV